MDLFKLEEEIELEKVRYQDRFEKALDTLREDNYPPEYRGGKEFQYLEERNPGYQDCLKILSAIAEYKAKATVEYKVILKAETKTRKEGTGQTDNLPDNTKYKMSNGDPLFVRSIAMVCYFQKREPIDPSKVLDEFGVEDSTGNKKKLYEYYKGLPKGFKPDQDNGQSRHWYRRRLNESITYLESIHDGPALTETAEYQNTADTFYS